MTGVHREALRSFESESDLTKLPLAPRQGFRGPHAVGAENWIADEILHHSPTSRLLLRARPSLLLPNSSSPSHLPTMADTEEIQTETGASMLPKDVTQEIGSIKLFNKWSYDDVEIRDISLTYVCPRETARESGNGRSKGQSLRSGTEYWTRVEGFHSRTTPRWCTSTSDDALLYRQVGLTEGTGQTRKSKIRHGSYSVLRAHCPSMISLRNLPSRSPGRLHDRRLTTPPATTSKSALPSTCPTAPVVSPPSDSARPNARSLSVSPTRS